MWPAGGGGGGRYPAASCSLFCVFSLYYRVLSVGLIPQVSGQTSF